MTPKKLKPKAVACFYTMNNEPYILGIMLNNKYKPSELSQKSDDGGVNALRGVDFDRYKLLKSASDSLDKKKQLTFYICQVTKKTDEDKTKKEDDGEDEEKDEDEEEDENTIEVNTWFDYKGDEVFETVDMEIFDFVLTKRNEYPGNKYEANFIVGQNFNKYMLVVSNKYTFKDIQLNIQLCNNFESSVDKLLKRAMNATTKIDEKFKMSLRLVLKRLIISDNLYDDDYWKKIVQILDKIDDVTLILEFINKNMAEKPLSLFTNFIANWLVKYGFDSIMPSLKQHVQPKSTNLFDNCHITMSILNNDKKDMAFEYLNEHVLPTLNDKTELAKVIKTHEPDQEEAHYRKFHHIVQTILLFENQEESMKKLKDCLIEFVKAESIGPLISKFLENPDDFKSSPSIRALLEFRRDWLTNQKCEEFNWRMPNASFPDYPQVESFLKSELEQMNLVGVFSGRVDARGFVKKYNQIQYQNGFSFNATQPADGIGAGAYITITKTKDYYNKKVEWFKEHEQEIQKIESFLNL